MFWLRHFMQTAFVVFEGLTALDFVGIFDPLSRLSSMRLMPDFQWRICSLVAMISDGNRWGAYARVKDV